MNNYQKEQDKSIKIIRNAYRKYGRGLFVLSSFGADAGMLLSLVKKTGLRIPVITIDTGFLFPETHLYKHTLKNKFDMRVITYGPYKDEVEQIAFDRLWEKDIDAYHHMVKVEPLKRAVEELGVEALLQGVRADQTEARANLSVVEEGQFGEDRVHPLLEWKKPQVEKYQSDENVPRNLLFYEGYESIGDWTTTMPGFGRSGRRLGLTNGCGLVIGEGGKLVSA
ncbi:MAG TPA: phosphoadenylyl-sulfate reductase [Candidatus Saccharimonadales bacterium]|nr:phosphoadenylyl-sulfate reductase [Candidatus Saccharimonadales bacterium]